MKSKTFSAGDVDLIAQLANIPVSNKEKQDLAEGFTKVLSVLDTIGAIDVSKVEPTHQVTDLENVMREDVIETSRMFFQEQALANAPKTYNGYFVVKQVLVE